MAKINQRQVRQIVRLVTRIVRQIMRSRNNKGY